MTTVALLNDTRGTWHAGSDAVMDVLERLIAEAEMVVTARASVNAGCAPPETADADLVLVNGEGTLHHGRGEWLMEALAAAQERGQRTALVNALWQQDPEWHGETIAQLDLFAARDPWSFNRHAEALDGWATCRTLAPDLSIDAVVPWHPLPLSSAHIWGESRFCPWLAEVGGFAGVSLRALSFARSVEKLNYLSGVYVTGEHHGIYAALLAGTPFVAVPSNSWKMEALVDWLGWGRVCQSPEEVREEVERARGDRAAFLEARDRFLALPRMTAADLRRAVE